MTPFGALLAGRDLAWLVTGSAGFIGSHLVETLLLNGQRVVSLDNFSTGKWENLREVAAAVGKSAWQRHRVIEGDTADPQSCRTACRGVDVVLHQAALGSVPRSIADPAATHRSNVTGFVNMLNAARAAKARFVYASSSAIYGDHPALPKSEDVIGRALSPYAVSKHANELYAGVYARCYGMQTIGLRYFNVFGPRQDPDGPYAAVIPRWMRALLAGEPVEIYGDGETTRDFSYVANAVQANLRAALTERSEALGRVYNVAGGESVSLNRLFEMLRGLLAERRSEIALARPLYRPFREGDVRYSLADIRLARELLGYAPGYNVSSGLREAISWYLTRSAPAAAVAC